MAAVVYPRWVMNRTGRIRALVLASLLLATPASVALAGLMACCLGTEPVAAETSAPCHAAAPVSATMLDCCSPRTSPQDVEVARLGNSDDTPVTELRQTDSEAREGNSDLVAAIPLSAGFHPDVGRYVLHSSYLL